MRSRQNVPFNTRRLSTRATLRGLFGSRGCVADHSKSDESERAIVTFSLRSGESPIDRLVIQFMGLSPSGLNETEESDLGVLAEWIPPVAPASQAPEVHQHAGEAQTRRSGDYVVRIFPNTEMLSAPVQGAGRRNPRELGGGQSLHQHGGPQEIISNSLSAKP